jgi:hypothetical protein
MKLGQNACLGNCSDVFDGSGEQSKAMFGPLVRLKLNVDFFIIIPPKGMLNGGTRTSIYKYIVLNSNSTCFSDIKVRKSFCSIEKFVMLCKTFKININGIGPIALRCNRIHRRLLIIILSILL